MKKPLLLFLSLFFSFTHTGFVFCGDREFVELAGPVPGEMDETIIFGLLAGAETLLSNGLVMFTNIFIYNKFISEASWTTPTSDSVYKNFTSPWEWEETDDFKVNQMGHPYQGSMYFSAGRVNGFSFYESSFFSALGSYTWETLGENHPKSMNDFITTVGSSLSLGEMLYRLYIEASAAGVPSPLTFFINPMAGFHRLAAGWKPPASGGNIREFRVYLGAGYAETDSSAESLSGSQEVFSFRGAAAHFGFSLVYGDPFEQDSQIPFNHFELALSLGVHPGDYLGIRLVSDAYLFSFSPVYAPRDKMSTGLSLHLDSVSQGKFDQDSTIDQFSNALAWTVKYRHLFRNGLSLQVKLHAGLTYLGVSEFYTPEDGDEYNKNYGSGFNLKGFVRLEHERLGILELGALRYVLWPYPNTSALSEGKVSWLFIDAAYSFRFSKHLSLEVCDSLALEQGTFDTFPDTRKHNNEIKIFFAWNL